MAVAEVSVKRALDSQEDLKDRREHCSADARALAASRVEVGHQARVWRNGDEYALYTVSEARDEQRQDVVRMGLAGRRRLATSDEFDGRFDAQVVHPTLAADEARRRGEFVERLDDDGQHSGLIAIAPHGGAIEPHTDEQAEHVRERLAVSAWRCKGFKRGEGAYERWHITSTDIHEASFPRLGSVMGRGFAHAVAFHGFDDPEILIGGGAGDYLKQQIAAAIERVVAGSGIAVRVAAPSDGFGGGDERNIVNRLSAGGMGGIQIEQSLTARDNHWRAIADAVADVYEATP